MLHKLRRLNKICTATPNKHPHKPTAATMHGISVVASWPPLCTVDSSLRFLVWHSSFVFEGTRHCTQVLPSVRPCVHIVWSATTPGQRTRPTFTNWFLIAPVGWISAYNMRCAYFETHRHNFAFSSVPHCRRIPRSLYVYTCIYYRYHVQYVQIFD